MSEPDPYRPPGADLDGTGGLPPRPVRGVLTGMLVDWGGTIMLSIVFAIVYSGMLAARGLSEPQIIAVLESSDLTSGFGLLNTAMGTLMSFLGGWVCVRAGRSTSLKPPAVLAVLGVLVGLWLGSGDLAIGVTLMLILFSSAATMIGAWQAIVRMRT